MRRPLNHKKSILLTTVIAFIISAIYISNQLTAADELLQWLKLDTMDTNFDIVENKAGDQDILLELDVEDAGTYNLYYYLSDGQQTFIELTQSYEQLDISYHIRENDGSGGFTDITQDQVDLSYLEINYELTVPDWEFDGDKEVGTSGGLEYSISRSASTKYPGVAFDVNNKQVLIKWDFQEEKAYILINDYEDGKIMPILFETPSKGSESMKVLKQLEDFELSPTHYITTDGAFNIQVNPVAQPNDTDTRPGSEPGLDVTFKQPKEMNPVTWQYEYGLTDLDDVVAVFELADIGSDAYLDFNLNLKNDGDQLISNIAVGEGTANDNVSYVYDAANYEYTIHIVEDKSDLAEEDVFVQWSELAASSLYSVGVGFQVDLDTTTLTDYEFTGYEPDDGFAATYMAYELQRSTVEEAYLDVTPFNAGDEAEIEYTILYSKVIKETLDIDEDLWLKNYHTSEDGNDEIFIPVPFRSTSSQDAYQIVVTFAGTEIYSQVLNYRAIDDADVPPTTPEIEAIDNLFVVPPLSDDTTDPEKVQVDIVWSALTNKDVQELDTIFEDLDGDGTNDKLFYELAINDVPTDDDTNPFQVVKVFEVKKALDGTYYLELYALTPGDEDPSNVVNFIDGYNITNEQFRMDSIVLRDQGAWTNEITTVYNDDDDTYTVTDSGSEASVEYPGVNYIRMKAIVMKDGELAKSDLSIPTSLSLSLNAYDIPIVDTLSYDPLYGVEEDRTSGITLEWLAVDTSNYETYMLSPIGKAIQSTVYTVYVSEDKSALLPMDDTDDNYIEITPETVHEITIDEDEISLLRDDEVIYFDVYDTGADGYSVEIEGLDVNMDYNIRIVTKLLINDQPVGVDEDEVRRSEPSAVLSATVPQAPDEPGDEELLPLAPEFFTVNFADDSEINAKLQWTMPSEMDFEEDMHGFEIFAIEDRHLPEELEGSDIGLIDLVTHTDLDGDIVEGWRLYVDNGETVFEKYDETTGTYVTKNLNLVSRDDVIFTMIDDANAPNRVNYYYVRTVKIEDTSVISASRWTEGTLTSAPVKEPINLTVDYETDYTYEPKEAFIIRFDAPISSADQVGSDYIMEVHVKGEDDTDYSITTYPSTYLGTNDQGAAGYVRLFYRIDDLKPGKTYNIKVRIEDRTEEQEALPDGSLAYPKSTFTDIVSSRTEFDQESYDKEQKYNEFLEYYVMKAEELKELPYFQITGSSNETAIKYRENYAEGMVQLNRNSDLYLYSESNSVNTYYIPSNTLDLVNDLNVTLIIESKDQMVGMRPDTVGERITDEINAMLEDIERYTSENEDWYLRIKVFTDDYNGQVNGENPAGPLTELQLAVVGSGILEETVDELMENQLDTVISANKADLIEALDQELELGINDELLLEIVQEVVEEVRIEYMGQASILFKSYLEDTATSILEIDQSVYVALKPEETESGHGVYSRVNGSWQFEPSNYLNDAYYVESTVLKPYLLLGADSGSQALADTYGQDALTVINAYNLTSIFSGYDLEHPEEELDKYQWISATARLAGADAGEDNLDWLEARDIFGTSLNLYSPMAYEEALMTYVDTYAYRHRVDMSAVAITDYTIIEDIEAVREAYQMPMIRAANLGIIDTVDGMLNPDETITVEDAMKLLTTLHNGIE